MTDSTRYGPSSTGSAPSGPVPEPDEAASSTLAAAGWGREPEVIVEDRFGKEYPQPPQNTAAGGTFSPHFGQDLAGAECAAV